MSDYNADAQIQDIVVEAVVTRADGTVEDLGVISRLELESNPGLVSRLRTLLAKRD